ncbi:jasmonate O-methyltransferase-like protein [Tanacetum coccineum]
MRSKEIVHGGRMVLTLLCRSMADSSSHDSGYKWKLLAQTLLDMVEEVIQEDTLPRDEGTYPRLRAQYFTLTNK